MRENRVGTTMSFSNGRTANLVGERRERKLLFKKTYLEAPKSVTAQISFYVNEILEATYFPVVRYKEEKSGSLIVDPHITQFEASVSVYNPHFSPDRNAKLQFRSEAKGDFPTFVIEHLFERLDPENLKSLAQHIKDNAEIGGGIFYSVVDRPSDEFMELYEKHIGDNSGVRALGNVVAITRGAELRQEANGNGNNGNNGNNHVETGSTDVIKTRHVIEMMETTSVKNAVKFFAVTRDGNEISEPVGRAIDQLNELLLPYKYEYSLLAAGQEKIREEQKKAIMLIATGVGLTFGLEPVHNTYIKEAIGALSGEGMLYFINKLGSQAEEKEDAFKKRSLETTAKWLEKETGVSVTPEALQQQIDEVLEKHKKDKEKGKLPGEKRRDALLWIWMLGVIGAGIALKAKTGNIGYYLGVAPINTSSMGSVEIYNRKEKIGHIKRGSQTHELVQGYLKSASRILGKLAKNHPELALAIWDYRQNPAAVVGWGGAVVAFAPLFYIEPMIADMAFGSELIITASGIFAEQVPAAAASYIALRRKPWDRFSRDKHLHRVEEMEQRVGEISRRNKITNSLNSVFVESESVQSQTS